MTIISGSTKDPDVKPEQMTATILHYEQVRTSARRTIRIPPRLDLLLHAKSQLCQIHMRIRLLRIKTRHQFTVVHHERDFDEARNPCRCFQMPDVGLDRPNTAGPASISAADNFADGIRLDGIAQRRARRDHGD